MARVWFEALLCDVDGVVRQWDGSMERIDAQFGLAPGTLAGIAFRPDLLTPAITGVVTDEEWRASVIAELADQAGSHERATKIVTTWSEHRGRVDHAVLDALAAARDVCHVVLVSNATTRLHADLTELGVIAAVDSAVSSADLGVAKPDPRVYLTVAENLGVPPDRCMFVDDTPAHVESAQHVGMTGVEFRGADRLRHVLTENGLLT